MFAVALLDGVETPSRSGHWEPAARSSGCFTWQVGSYLRYTCRVTDAAANAAHDPQETLDERRTRSIHPASSEAAVRTCARLMVRGGTWPCRRTLLVLPVVPPSPPLQLRERLPPLADPRVVTTLATSLLVIFAAFLIYTYMSVVFDRATGVNSARLAALPSIWGVAATVGNLVGGTLADRFGS